MPDTFYDNLEMEKRKSKDDIRTQNIVYVALMKTWSEFLPYASPSFILKLK